MTNPINQKEQLQIIICPQCQGEGIIENHYCKECQGRGIFGWTGEILLYWGKKIDNLQIANDKVKEIINNLITFVFILAAIAGFIMLGWVFLLLNQQNLPFWQFYRFHNLQMFVFWSSLFTDSYLFYRLSTQLDKIRTIPKRKYLISDKIPRLISWPEVKELKSKQKVDVSEFFDNESIETVKKAWQFTNRYGHCQTAPIHLLISLLTFNQVGIIFSRLGVPFNSLKARISRILSKQLYKSDQTVIISVSVYKILLKSYYQAWHLHQSKVNVTELLESLVAEDEATRELLYDVNIDLSKINNVISWLRVRKQLQRNWQRFRHRASFRPKGTMNRSMTAIATPILDGFSQDLTVLAKYGYLLPCVGREKEIEETYRVMQGGTRQSVILLGNPGVGRTTIVEGIAQKMVEEDVPDFLQDKRLVSLSIAKLVSGAPAAEAQHRLMLILNEVRRSGNIILFISDIHNMVGITAGRQGSIDLAGTLAKTLATNTVLCITTSTPNDYRRYIEGKSELEEVLEVVNVPEVSGDVAIQVLQAKAGALEYKSQVYFSYDAIAKTVELSDRYLHDRYLPEKAIEILQEVANHVKETKPKNSIVTANDVAVIISNKTNIPLTEITAEESEKLLNLEDKIHERIIDQEEAVSMVATSLRRARAEMRDLARPIVNLLFLGPTGVGKTELAKTVADVYFSGEENMIRVDMSEYQEKSSINRLIGAPPGYGDDQGGYLTQAVRKNPFSLLLFDEIEKAHPDILNILLQVMDDGRLTDSSGRTIDFTNVILIATSNAATSVIQQYFNAGTSVEEIKNILVDQELGKYFRPEFLNRFDGIVIFKPLTMNEVKQIAHLMLKKVAASLEPRGIKLAVSQEALIELSQAGFDPKFGARPLRRVIQQRVQDALANYLLAGKIGRRDTAVVEARGKIRIEKAQQL